GVRAPHLRGRAPPARVPAGRAGSHHLDLLGREDLLRDGLEDRLAHGAAGADHGDHRGEAVADLLLGSALPARGGGGPGDAAPGRPAVAAGRAWPPAAFHGRAGALRGRRDLLTVGLREIGFRVSVPEAGYFTVADASPLGEPDADALAERLPAEAGVVAIPLTAFYREGQAGAATAYLRMAFCKSRATIEQALEKLEAWAAPRR